MPLLAFRFLGRRVSRISLIVILDQRMGKQEYVRQSRFAESEMILALPKSLSIYLCSSFPSSLALFG